MMNTESKYMENLRNQVVEADKAMRNAMMNGDFDSAIICAKRAADIESILIYHTYRFGKF